MAEYPAPGAQDMRQALRQIVKRNRAGQIGYTEVVVAQVSALIARRNVLQLQVAQQLAAVGLIQALGGGWQGLEGQQQAAR